MSLSSLGVMTACLLVGASLVGGRDAPTRSARGSRYEDFVSLHQPGGTRGLRCRRCGVGESVRPFTVHLPVDGGGVPT